MSGEALSVLYRDGGLVIINKPSGMAVHRGWSQDRTTVLSTLRDQLGCYVYPVHRLDRGASGALLFALSGELAARAQQALSAVDAIKNYLFLCRGILPARGIVDHAIAKSKAHEKRPARTAFERLHTFERYSVGAAALLTGRLHQIRRHMKHISHPLIGDTRYGKGEHNRLFRERVQLRRLVLHAYALSFRHPETAERLSIVAPPPGGLLEPLCELGAGAAISEALGRGAWLPEPDWPQVE